MRMRSWPFLLIGFSALLLLVGLSSAALDYRIETVRTEVEALQRTNEESSRVLQELRADTYLVSVLLRDYLMERSPEAAAKIRLALDEVRQASQRHLRVLHESAVLKDRHEVQQLRVAIESYWDRAETVFEWTPEQKAYLGLAFLRQRLVPQRETAFQLASEIEKVSRSEARYREGQILRTQEDLRTFLRRVATAALILGFIVAVISVARTRSLEATAERNLHLIERAAEDLRRLSSRLSRAQEDERRSISRELHDQVGQMLTALRLALANVEEFRTQPGDTFERHLADARKLAEDTLRTVRDISMGLRPSVLDELGLGPALRWQAREFTRRSGVPVEIQLDGSLDKLPDTHRTCVYRIVQEALTNCARHASATQIRISVHGGPAAIALAVEDDGVGFDVRARHGRGLGLLGAEERVRELGGRMDIVSQASKGTLLRCDIPTLPEVSA